MRRATMVVLLGLGLGCAGKAVVDGPAAGGGGAGGAAGGGGTTSSTPSSGTTTTLGCPDDWVDEYVPCDTVGLECPRADDPFCWDWTCICQPNLTFYCEPGACA